MEVVICIELVDELLYGAVIEVANEVAVVAILVNDMLEEDELPETETEVAKLDEVELELLALVVEAVIV